VSTVHTHSARDRVWLAMPGAEADLRFHLHDMHGLPETPGTPPAELRAGHDGLHGTDFAQDKARHPDTADGLEVEARRLACEVWDGSPRTKGEAMTAFGQLIRRALAVTARTAYPADWGGEPPERIARVLSDLLALTDPARGDGLLSFAERKVLGAAADLLREARERQRSRG
jgi:hypothetical protein